MTSLRAVFVPPAGNRVKFHVASGLVFVVLLVFFLLLPRGSATVEPIAGDPASVEVTDDVGLRLEPSVRELGWREGMFDSPYELSVRTTVANGSGSEFPDSVRMRIIRGAGTDGEVEQTTMRSANVLMQTVVPPGESATFLLTFMADSACGNFTAYVDFSRFDVADPAEAFVAPSVEIPFTVGDPPCE